MPGVVQYDDSNILVFGGSGVSNKNDVYKFDIEKEEMKKMDNSLPFSDRFNSNSAIRNDFTNSIYASGMNKNCKLDIKT